MSFLKEVYESSQITWATERWLRLMFPRRFRHLTARPWFKHRSEPEYLRWKDFWGSLSPRYSTLEDLYFSSRYEKYVHGLGPNAEEPTITEFVEYLNYKHIDIPEYEEYWREDE